MIKNVKALIIIITIVFVVLFIIISLLLKNKPVENFNNVEENDILDNEKLINLIKSAIYTLDASETLESGSITDEAMIRFALSYIQTVDEDNNIEYTESVDEIPVDKIKIEQAVKIIFDRNIEYSKISYAFDSNKIYIPNYPIGTDMQVYKFREKKYNEQEGTYIAYIDCLEPAPELYSDLSTSANLDYDKASVVKTLEFKYKIKDQNKILLAYNKTSNK